MPLTINRNKLSPWIKEVNIFYFCWLTRPVFYDFRKIK